MIFLMLLALIAIMLFIYIEVSDIRFYKNVKKNIMEDFYANVEDNYQAQQINDYINMDE